MIRRTALAITAMLLPATAWAVPLYTAVDVGTPIPDSGYIIGTGINSSGQVTGYAYAPDFSRATTFLYSNGQLTDIGVGTTSQGAGINDSGKVAITASGTTGQYVATYQNGTYSTVPNAASATPVGTAYAINNQGKIAGSAAFDVPGQGTQLQAATFYNGVTTNLNTLDNNTRSYSQALNNTGMVVGVLQGTAPIANSQYYTSYNHAFVYSNGVMTDIGGLNGRTDSVASGVNDGGLVVGYSLNNDGSNSRAFTYRNGVMTQLGAETGQQSAALGVNSSGQIVGYSINAQDGSAYGMLSDGTTMYNINDYIVSGLPTTIQTVVAINDNGQMVALGNDYHTYLLSKVGPTQASGLAGSSDVPEPGLLALGALATLGFAATRRRQKASSRDDGMHAVA